MKKTNFPLLACFHILCFCLISICVEAQTLKYTYDALGRVQTVDDTVNGNRDYKYDAAGNRINVAVQSKSSSSISSSRTSSSSLSVTSSSSPLTPSSSSSTTSSSSPFTSSSSLPSSSSATSTGLTAPTGLNVKGPLSANGGYNFSWNPVAGAVSYQGKLVDGTPFTSTMTNSGSAVALPSWVGAVNAIGTGPVSFFSISLPLDTISPTMIGLPNVSNITTTSAAATWSATDNVGVIGYDYNLNGGAWIPAGTGASFSSLSPSTTYILNVRAKDGNNNISTTSTTSFQTAGLYSSSSTSSLSSSSLSTSSSSSYSSSSSSATSTGLTAPTGLNVKGPLSANGGYNFSWNPVAGAVSYQGKLVDGTPFTSTTTSSGSAVALPSWVGAVNAIGSGPISYFSISLPLDTISPTMTGLPAISNITTTSATGTWSATDNVGVIGYDYNLNGGAWISAGTGVSFNGLSPSTTYSLNVRAKDGNNNISTTSTASFLTADMPDTTRPIMTGSPSVSSLTYSSVVLSWSATDNVGVTGYQYRVNNGAWNSAGAGVTLTGLAPLTPYIVEVQAKDAANNYSTSTSASFTTLASPDTTPPIMTGSPSVSSLTYSSAVLSWSATDNVGVTGYQYRVNNGAWNLAGAGVTLTGLAPLTPYIVEVQAKDAANNYSTSTSASFTTLVQPDTTNPVMSGSPSMTTIAQTTATAAWPAATDNIGVVAYEYRITQGAWQSAGNTLSATILGLVASTSYSLEVRAKDAANNYSSPTGVNFSTPAPAVPAPTGLRITGGPYPYGGYSFAWTAVPGATSYEGELQDGTPFSSTVAEAGCVKSRPNWVRTVIGTNRSVPAYWSWP